jgi:uncharacterized Zn-finger protein
LHTLIAPPSQPTFGEREENPKLSLLLQVAYHEIEQLKKENLWYVPVKKISPPLTVPIIRRDAKHLDYFDKETIEKEIESVKALSFKDNKGKQCPLCQNSYKGKSELIRHLKYHHKPQNRRYPCPYCPEGFVRKNRLEKHIKKHEDE